MNSINSNYLYIILNYALNTNIYKLISSIEKFCFSYSSLSLQNNFNLYIIYNDSYTILFPNKIKDPTLLNTSNYHDISNSISENLKYFFNTVTQAEEKLNQNDIKNKPNAINIILKKILLEINQKKKSKEILGDATFLLSSDNDNEKNDRIILINDSENDFDEINQKYIFLLKKEKIKIDILSINELNKNKTSKAICLFTNGFFDNVKENKNNIEQILIQEYMPIERKEINKKVYGNIKNSINYNKVISNEDFSCSICHKIMINKEEKNDSISNNSSYTNNFSMSRSSSDVFNRVNSNSVNNIKLFYWESEKNIICYNCLKDKKQ